MGIMGEMFGPKVNKDGDEDSNGQTHQPRFDLDLDGGTVRIPGRSQPAKDEPEA